MPSSSRQLVAAHRRRGAGPVAASRAPPPSARSASSRCASIARSAFLPRVASRSAQRQQRHLHLHRRRSLEVAVDGAPVERALVDQEAEHQVVAGRRAPRKRQRRSLVRSRRQMLAHHLLAEPVVAHERHATVLAHAVGGGLADVVEECAEAQRLPASQLVRERLVQHLRASSPARLRSRARSAAPAPRACGRRRRGGGSGSAPRHAGRRARAAPPAPGRAGPRVRAPPTAPGASTRRRSSANRRSPDASLTRGAASAVSRSVSRIGSEAELGGEARQPQGSQRVVLVGRRAEYAQRPGLEVGVSAERVDQLAALGRSRGAPDERARHRVDREVALRQVLLDGLALERSEVVHAAAAPVDHAPGAEGLGELEHRPAEARPPARAPRLRDLPRRRCRYR